MKPGQGLGLYADYWYNRKNSKEGLHATAAHLKCLMQNEALEKRVAALERKLA